MVINMDESQLRTLEQIKQFLAASAEVAFTAHGDDLERSTTIYRLCWRTATISIAVCAYPDWSGC